MIGGPPRRTPKGARDAAQRASRAAADPERAEIALLDRALHADALEGEEQAAAQRRVDLWKAEQLEAKADEALEQAAELRARYAEPPEAA